MARIVRRVTPCKHKLHHYETLKRSSSFLANTVFSPKYLDKPTKEALLARGWKTGWKHA